MIYECTFHNFSDTFSNRLERKITVSRQNGNKWKWNKNVLEKYVYDKENCSFFLSIQHILWIIYSILY